MSPEMRLAPFEPYAGPRPLATGEQIFGRDREIRDLRDLLIYKRFILLHSASGAGKTSLIQAGLIPALNAYKIRVTNPPIRVGKEPPEGFKKTGKIYNRYLLSTFLSLEEGFPTDQQLKFHELAGLNLESYLKQRQQRLASPGSEEKSPLEVLIFDQFEEIVSLDPTDRSAKQEFFAQLGAWLSGYQNLALFVMRDDFVAQIEDFLSVIPDRLGTRIHLNLLDQNGAKRAIQGPLESALNSSGVKIDDQAALSLVRDLSETKIQSSDGTVIPVAGTYIEPVQLQVVCYRIWELWQKSGKAQKTITVEELNALRSLDQSQLGDSSLSLSPVDTALGGYYAAKVKEVADKVKGSERRIRDWFEKQLITQQGLRGQVLKTPEKTQELENTTIDELIAAYLVRKEERRGLIWFELAHDRLIPSIRENNRLWYEKNLEPFQKQAALWLAQNRIKSLLLFGDDLVNALQYKGELTGEDKEFLEASKTVYGEDKSEWGTNLDEIGWGVIFRADEDPNVRDALAELLDHRRSQATARYYKEFSGSNGFIQGDTARSFLLRQGCGYGPAKPDKVPYYLLIVGSPEQIPFDFQYELDEDYSVGRIYFEKLEDYTRYARSVVTTEKGGFSLPKRLVIFAPAHSNDRATLMTSQMLAKPLAGQFGANFPGWEIRSLFEEDATKANLGQVFGGENTPALAITIAHGMEYRPNDPLLESNNGAIVCQSWDGEEIRPGDTFSGNDIPDQARLLGMLAFMFGNDTAGTPSKSESTGWASPTKEDGKRPFVARMAQRLLSHPNGGALGVIGHVGQVWSYSFIQEQGQPDLRAIVDTIEQIMRGHTIGMACDALNQRYLTYYRLLAEQLIGITYKKQKQKENVLQEMFLRTLDARNYILIGDPAARLPLDTGPILTEWPSIQPVLALHAEEELEFSFVGEVSQVEKESVPLSPVDIEGRLIFNGLEGENGAYALTVLPEELNQLILQGDWNKAMLPELRYLLSRSQSKFGAF
jgi:hypothetical protein